MLRRELILKQLWLAATLVLCHACSSNQTVVELSVQVPPGATASATFHLLDADPFALAMRAKGGAGEDEKAHREHSKLRALAGLMNARRREAYSLSRDVFLFLEQSEDLWRAHIVQSVQTDRQGRAAFKHLKPGSYWVMGELRATGVEAFWLQQVPVASGVNHLSFNRQNALYFGPQQ